MARHTVPAFMPYVAVSMSCIGVAIQASILVPNSRVLRQELEEVKAELVHVEEELAALRGVPPKPAEPAKKNNAPDQPKQPVFFSWRLPSFGQVLSS